MLSKFIRRMSTSTLSMPIQFPNFQFRRMSVILLQLEMVIVIIHCLGLSDLEIFNDTYFYWRSTQQETYYYPTRSQIYFDYITRVEQIKVKQETPNFKNDFSLFKGFRPHLSKIYYDQNGETLSAFKNFTTLVIWPLLHQNSIKIRNSGNEAKSNEIIVTKLREHSLYSFQQDDDIMREYSIRTGKLLSIKNVKGNKKYMFHQHIDNKYTMLKAKTPSLNSDEESLKLNKFNQKLPKSVQISISSFGIDSINSEKVSIYKYQVVTLGSENEEIDIKKNFTFFGPGYIEQNSNYDLYISSDLKHCIFYFRDASKDLRQVLYRLNTLEEHNAFNNLKIPNDENLSKDFLPQIRILDLLNKESDSLENAGKSLKQQQQNDERFPKSILGLSPDFTMLFEENQKGYSVLQTLETKKCQAMFKQQSLGTLLKQQIDFSTNLPSFISENEILLVNSNNIILCVELKTQENEPFVYNGKEKFTFTQCPFPGADSTIDLNTMIKSENYYFGVNTFIYECSTEKSERIMPNYFNQFLKGDPIVFDSKVEDSEEIRLIQRRYKTKIEIPSGSQFGYIFQSAKNKLQNRNNDLRIVSTFNFFYFRLIDHIERKIIGFDELTDLQIQELCYTQLPDGATILNKINFFQIQSLFERVEANLNEKFFVPILEDKQQENIFDKIFKQKMRNSTKKRKESQNEADNSQNQNNALLKQASLRENSTSKSKLKIKLIINFLLEQVGKYPFDLFKINFSNVVDKLIEQDINSFCKFLESRSKSLDFLETVKTGNIFCNKVTVFSSDQIWQVDEEQLQSYAREDAHLSAFFGFREQGNVDLKVLDFPFIHSGDEKAKSVNFLFLSELHERGNAQCFTYGSVKAIIEVRNQFLKKRFILFQILPYIAFVIVFTIFTIFDYNSYLSNHENKTQGIASTLRVFMIIGLLYFIAIYIMQMYQDPRRVVNNLWNLTQIISLVFVSIGEMIELKSRALKIFDQPDGPTNEQMIDAILRDYRTRILYSIAALFIWFRLLYFFRIVRSTNYYIRMIIEVLLDLRNFIFMFVTVIVAFAHAFLLLGRDNGEGPLYEYMWDSIKMTYQIPIGNYDLKYGEYNNWLTYSYFVVASFFLNVLFMNVIISIISETFARIKENYQTTMNRDFLSLIIENKAFFWGFDKSDNGKKYLYFTVPDEKPDENQNILDLMVTMSEDIKQMKFFKAELREKLSSLKRIEQKELQIIQRLERIEAKREVKN